MHELSLCVGIVELLQENARQERYSRVKSIQLEIGRLACVEADALRFVFDAAAHNTLAEHAVLEIVEIPGRAWCHQCETLVAIEQRFDACPLCGACPLELRAGDEMRIKHVEVI